MHQSDPTVKVISLGKADGAPTPPQIVDTDEI